MHLRHHQSIKIGILRYIYVHLHTTYVHRAFTNSLAVKTYLYRLLSAADNQLRQKLFTTYGASFAGRKIFLLKEKPVSLQHPKQLGIFSLCVFVESIANRTHIPTGAQVDFKGLFTYNVSRRRGMVGVGDANAHHF